MKLRITLVTEIPNEELIEAGINPFDLDAISDYYYSHGGEDAFQSYGESIEFVL